MRSLTPRSPRGSGGRSLRFLRVCPSRGSLGHRSFLPGRRCPLNLGVVNRIAWFILLLGGGVLLGRCSPRAGWELRLLRQRPLVCGGLRWNGGIIFLLLDSFDTSPSGGFLGSWSRVGLVLVGDGCISCSPPGGCPRVRRRTRFLGRRGSGLNLFRRGGCGSPTGHSGGRWI